MLTYRIANWANVFEGRDEKRVAGPLSWVRFPTHDEGFGFARLMARPDKSELLAVYVRLVQVCARQRMPERCRSAAEEFPAWPAQRP